jgi:hypothetical protein
LQRTEQNLELRRQHSIGSVSLRNFLATLRRNSARQGAVVPYLFGPRFNMRRKTVTPFGQVLPGGVATSSGIEQLGWQSHFAMTAGGGIDVRLSRHFSIRPAQAEYFMTKLPDGLDNRQNNFRFSTGVSLLLGQR